MKPREKSALKGVIVFLFCLVAVAITSILFVEYLEMVFFAVLLVTIFVINRHFHARCPKCGSWDTTKRVNASRQVFTSDIRWFVYRTCKCGHTWMIGREVFLSREEYSSNSRYW